jgi:molybdopterin/thiamine biosynthesis adenylyltransferase
MTATAIRLKHETAMTQTTFIYEEAFRRNIGWVTRYEQQLLRNKRVAIAGLGGVGGSHVTTLARLGIGSFTLADFDVFELANFNRQAGAKISTLGMRKIDVVAAMAHDINPEIQITSFDKGVKEDQIDIFLKGADIYVDSLDGFAIDMRRKVFARCYALGIPAVTAGPFGMSTAFLIFMPGGMTFEEWFRLEGLSGTKQLVNFIMGAAPAGLHFSYLVDPSAINLETHNFPSTGLSCELCAGVVAAQTLKILLGRGPIEPVPTYHQFDAYKCAWKKGRISGGNGNWRQRLKLALAYKRFDKMAGMCLPSNATVTSREIEKILDVARLAPSGDNVQPWSFNIIDDDHVTIFLHKSDSFFESILQCKGIFLSAGGLLETLRIAAAEHGRSTQWNIRREGDFFCIDVSMPKDHKQQPDPLYDCIQARSVNRFPYHTTHLTADQKVRLQETIGAEFELIWYESFQERLRSTLLNTSAEEIRLTMREPFDEVRKILDWENDFSTDRIPVNSLNLDPITKRLMRFMIKSWARVDFMNRFAGGTFMPKLQLDFTPGLNCAAHFVIRFRSSVIEPTTPEALIRAGIAIQRFWLAATSERLVMQPSFAPIVFALYPDCSIARDPFITSARRLAERVKVHTGTELSHIAFMGRIGTPRTQRNSARSIRLPLQQLTVTDRF